MPSSEIQQKGMIPMDTKVRIRLKTVDDVKDFVSSTLSNKVNAVLQSGRYCVDAKSIMGIFSLDLSVPITLVIECDSSDIDSYMDKIERFLID